MIEKKRFRCPCCGMVADLDQLDSGPYKIKVFLQRFGGKIAGENKGRGKARGLMTYDDITRSSKQEVSKIQEIIKMVAQNIG